MTENNTNEVAVFGGGCFWCIEAVFENIKGVVSVMSGYAGGQKANPTYEEVSSGQTGHAEVVKVEFDTSQISYDELLSVFFFSHDPTTKNRQGNDVGTQYRSVVFYTNDKQKNMAEKFVASLDAEKAYDNPVVTEILPLDNFYPAEEYHRQYYDRNSTAPYCQLVIAPKLEKLRTTYERLQKTNK